MTTEYELHREAAPYIEAIEPWSEALAERRAQEDGLGSLSTEQWQVIHTLRQHLFQYGAVPPMRYACGHNHLQPHCVASLFHGTREAWHIAGIADPGEEAWSYT